MRQKLSSPEGKPKATYRKFVFFSDAVRIFGKVTKKYIDSDGEYCVDIETHAVNQRGEDVMPGGMRLLLCVLKMVSDGIHRSI